MRIKITKPGIYNAKGEEVAVGTELTLKREPKEWAGRYETISGGGSGKVAVTNPAKPAYEAKHRGGGSYSVLDADGKEVVDKLSKEDAEAFNSLDEAEKAEYVAGAAKG
jgi:hypothetical protein